MELDYFEKVLWRDGTAFTPAGAVTWMCRKCFDCCCDFCPLNQITEERGFPLCSNSAFIDEPERVLEALAQSGFVLRKFSDGDSDTLPSLEELI